MAVTREGATGGLELPGGGGPALPIDRETTYLRALERVRSDFLAQGGFDGPPVSPRHRFESFVSGTASNVALQSCMAVCDHPGTLYNPLFIHGKPGVGKTHLLDSIYHALAARHPHLLVLRTSGESFGDELLAALANRWFERFRLKYRHVDVLLFDALSLKRGQEEFQVILEHLVGQGRQVVITSQVPVQQLEGASESLRSRLSGGLVVEMELPDLEVRKAIILQAAVRHDLDLPRDVAFAMARRLQADVRSLEGAVRRLVAWHGVVPRPWEKMGLDVLCRDMPLQATCAEITQEDVIEGVSAHFGLDTALLRQEKGRRPPEVTRARKIAMFLCRTLTDQSQEKVAQAFHATAGQVRYAVSGIQGQEGDPVLACDLEKIRGALQAKGTGEPPPTRGQRKGTSRSPR